MQLKDHKLRQKIYLSFNEEELASKKLIIKDDQFNSTVNESLLYFTIEQKELIYPSKAYAVAIIYSILLEKYFGIPYKESLNDKELFFTTNKFFKIYCEKQKTYDAIIQELKRRDLMDFEKNTLEQVKVSVQSFHNEFYTRFNNIEDILAEENSKLSSI